MFLEQSSSSARRLPHSSSRNPTIAVLLLLWLNIAVPMAQPMPDVPGQTAGAADERETETVPSIALYTQVQQLLHAMARLPTAAGLATLLALRPRRRGTPHRQPAVIQTQIILAVVGAVVMLVVGTSLARAFGIVGAAGLVRYRAKIADPKDAGVMLSTLAIGLASGVGMWMLAAFATVFVLVLLWVVESFEPASRQLFLLTIKDKDPAALRPKIEALLERSRMPYELRHTSAEELAYEVKVPLDKKTDWLSDAILKTAGKETNVEWEEKKDRNK